MERLPIVLIFCCLMIVSSCAALKDAAISPEDDLRRTAEAYWAARQEKDWKKVQSFVDPKILPNLKDYFKKHEESKNVSDIVSFTIRDLTTTGNEGRTWTVLSLRLVHPVLGAEPYPLEQIVENLWVRREGRWYVVIEPPNMADMLRKFNQRPAKPASGG